MRDETFVSIITPCYNAEKYIAETIKSVRNQTYQNWEMLICDDCSTDNSAEIIKEFCTKDNRIKYLKTDYNNIIEKSLIKYTYKKIKSIKFY